jgi:hypothetical protein
MCSDLYRFFKATAATASGHNLNQHHALALMCLFLNRLVKTPTATQQTVETMRLWIRCLIRFPGGIVYRATEVLAGPVDTAQQMSGQVTAMTICSMNNNMVDHAWRFVDSLQTFIAKFRQYESSRPLRSSPAFATFFNPGGSSSSSMVSSASSVIPDAAPIDLRRVAATMSMINLPDIVHRAERVSKLAGQNGNIFLGFLQCKNIAEFQSLYAYIEGERKTYDKIELAANAIEYALNAGYLTSEDIDLHFASKPNPADKEKYLEGMAWLANHNRVPVVLEGMARKAAAVRSMAALGGAAAAASAAIPDPEMEWCGNGITESQLHKILHRDHHQPRVSADELALFFKDCVHINDHIVGEFFWLCLKYHVRCPIGFHHHRPHVMLPMGQIILMAGYGAAGVSMLARPDYGVSADVSLKMILGHLTYDQATIVMNPAVLVVMDAALIVGYRGGYGLTPWRLDDSEHIQAYAEGRAEGERFVKGELINWRPPIHGFYDFSGSFPPFMMRSLQTEQKSLVESEKAIHGTFCKEYRAILNNTSDNLAADAEKKQRNGVFYSVNNPGENQLLDKTNTIMFQGPQIGYDRTTKQFTKVTRNMGPLGPNFTHSAECGEVLLGRRSLIPPLTPSGLPAGAIQAKIMAF